MRRLAIRTLRKNITSKGFTAGSTHFNDIWARDALYASLGALNVGLRKPVISTLQTLYAYQSITGQIPLRVGRKNMLKVFMKLPSETGAVYDNDKTSDPALDPNCLYCILVDRTYKKIPLLYKKSVEKSLFWLDKYRKKDLLYEGKYASWDDSIKKQSASIYNNVLYYQAQKAVYNITKKKNYYYMAEQTKKAINNLLWNDNYYGAWVDCDVLDVAGNLLAIIFDVADLNRQKKILYTIKKRMLVHNHHFPKTNYPKYSVKKVYLPFYLIGMGDYHNQGPYWSWIAVTYVLAQQKIGEKISYDKLRLLFSNKIYEIYDDNLKPVKKLFYKSEVDFSWTAGILLMIKEDLLLT